MDNDKEIKAKELLQRGNLIHVETYKKIITGMLETHYVKEITDYYGISDIIINGDKVIIQWYKKII